MKIYLVSLLLIHSEGNSGFKTQELRIWSIEVGRPDNFIYSSFLRDKLLVNM